MLPIIEFEKRAFSGPVMKPDEFDLALTKKMRKLVKEYDIKFNPDELIVDDETADKVFNAAVEFLVDIGIYHTETQRVIKLSREEVLEIAKEYRENAYTITFGKGKDEHTIAPRTSASSRRPVVWVSAAGAIPQDIFIPYLELCAKEEIYQGFGIAGGVTSVDGMVPREGAPSEMLCGLWEVEAQKEALRRAGRPDMHLGLIPTVSSVGATLALLTPGLREAHNSMVGIHIHPEQKIDWARLNLACAIEKLGISPWTSAMSMLGGLCGGPAGTAVGVTANLLAQLGYGHGRLGSIYISDMNGVNSSQGAIWAYSASLRAAERNIGIATGTAPGDGIPRCSIEEMIYRNISVAIVLTACGGAYNWSAGTTPLEGRLQADVMSGIAGMDRDKVNQILSSLTALVMELEAAGGTLLTDHFFPFPNKYDMKTFKPQPKYLDAFNRAVEKMVSIGVPISSKLSTS